ncbi:hypothetical protein Poly24_05620 [Rosistilla carotiformis]|uniref:Uncharacterized protein n=1 Tax=Rosistilla carotiformis TaxID=2528017 RepID=A0A518JMV5_9BACT|nr:hypothetical protein Poly24_05620 [Rosistilla carotiformis]
MGFTELTLDHIKWQRYRRRANHGLSFGMIGNPSRKQGP